jgi:hypothetical protein
MNVGLTYSANNLLSTYGFWLCDEEYNIIVLLEAAKSWWIIVTIQNWLCDQECNVDNSTSSRLKTRWRTQPCIGSSIPQIVTRRNSWGACRRAFSWRLLLVSTVRRIITANCTLMISHVQLSRVLGVALGKSHDITCQEAAKSWHTTISLWSRVPSSVTSFYWGCPYHSFSSATSPVNPPQHALQSAIWKELFHIKSINSGLPEKTG